jgi:hypothetical protein
VQPKDLVVQQLLQGWVKIFCQLLADFPETVLDVRLAFAILVLPAFLVYLKLCLAAGDLSRAL